jgi:acylphosphatase
MAAAGWRVTGRVQGVGFRWWTRAQATRLGISGTVRNCDDGAVEVLAVGEHAMLERFRAALLIGPPGARVDQLHELPAADTLGRESGFHILH